MYTLTLIRLALDTKQFQNTEVNNFMVLGDIEKQLSYHKADFSQVEKVLSMTKGQTITIQIENVVENNLWFYYIAKVN